MRDKYLRWTIVIGITFVSGMLAGHLPWLSFSIPMLENLAGQDAGHSPVESKQTYVCPMHAHVLSDHPGICPVCGMALVRAKQAAAQGSANTESAMDMADDKTGRPEVHIEPAVINNIGVKTSQVRRTTLRRRIETPGFVQQIQPGQTHRVTASLAARVASVRFRTGQWQKPDATLLVLESAELLQAEQTYLSLLQRASRGGVQPMAQAGVEETEASVTQATPTLAESRQALSQLGLSNADIEQLEHSGKASSQLSLSVSYSAMVSNPQVRVGDRVKAGALLFELTSMARASVLANAFQRDAAWIQTGQPVEIRLPHVSGGTWPGVVNQAAVSIDPNSQNIGVRLSFSAPSQLLKSAMYVVADIMGDPLEGVLAVPQTALIRTESEDRVVLALGQGRFKPVPVRTGIEASGQVEILSGLKQGDTVVTSAQFLIDSESSLQASFLRMSGSDIHD